jgi:hypothetical protein
MKQATDKRRPHGVRLTIEMSESRRALLITAQDASRLDAYLQEKPRHRQVHIVYGDRKADVDELLAPFILRLWREGIETVDSCQDWVAAGIPGTAAVSSPRSRMPAGCGDVSAAGSRRSLTSPTKSERESQTRTGERPELTSCGLPRTSLICPR